MKRAMHSLPPKYKFCSMKKETCQNIIYFPLYVWFKLHALLPMRMLYVLSDILFFPLYYLVHYRRKLVQENLRNAFPQKNKQELKIIEKKFYHHFCDYIVETIKLLHISDKEMRRRMVFEQVEIIDRLFDQNRSIIILLGHFGNWEWIPSITLWTQTTGVIFAQIYRPLNNEWFDRFFLRLRSRFGSVGIAKKETLRAILQMKRSGKPSITGFMADQTPSPANIHHWAQFLSQDSPVLTGYEKIARKTDFAVLYFDVEIVKRGYYKTTVREVALQPNECSEFEITDRYTSLMEQTILRNPWAWLWTHKRWKYKHENFPDS